MEIYVITKEYTNDLEENICTEVYLYRDYETALKNYENIKFEMKNFWAEHFEEDDYEINESEEQFVIYAQFDYHYNHESVKMTTQYLLD